MSGNPEGPPPKRPRQCQKAIDKLKKIVGVFDFNTSTKQEAHTPAQWISKNADEVKRQKTDERIRFLLGHGRAVENVEDAVNEIYNRDYPENKGRNQIFVPEQCVPTAQLMRQFDNLETH